MDKTAFSAARVRAKTEILARGGVIQGRHPVLPIIYALPPPQGVEWPVHPIRERFQGGRDDTCLTSYLNGCTVIWGVANVHPGCN